MTRLRPTQFDPQDSRGPAHFAMIEKQALHNLDDLMKLDMQSARLMVRLIKLLEPGSGGAVVVSKQTLSELLGVSDSTVKRALRTLVEGQWIQRMRIGSAHAIVINDTVAWVGKREDRRFAVFSATVIASRSEQDPADLEPKTLRKLPMLNEGEALLPFGADPEPPSQGLIAGTELLAVRGTDQSTRDELELHGQQRITD